jgi:radical SAM protein with 4Fe4S-binding SPASM domain
MWNSNVVTWDGKIVPCCFDKDAKYELGNVNRSSVAEIWRSEPYTKFRKNILMSRKEIDICTNCSEGTTIFKKI